MSLRARLDSLVLSLATGHAVINLGGGPPGQHSSWTTATNSSGI